LAKRIHSVHALKGEYGKEKTDSTPVGNLGGVGGAQCEVLKREGSFRSFSIRRGGKGQTSSCKQNCGKSPFLILGEGKTAGVPRKNSTKGFILSTLLRKRGRTLAQATGVKRRKFASQ